MSLHLPAPVRSTPAVLGAPPAMKAGPIGPGAGPLMTEYLLPSIMGLLPQQKMAKALQVGMQVDWVRAAERTIRDALTGCAWHLEDPDGETIDDDYKGNPLALDPYKLLREPQGELPLSGEGGVGRRQSRRQQLTLTSRHLGLAGNAAWYSDLIDLNGCPHAILYIRPDRLEPACTDNGVLTGWLLDKRPGFPGTPLELERLTLLQFEPPDEGVFGPGLIESAMSKAINNGLVDKHYGSLLASGGRLSGILSPKEGAITDDTVYQQLVRDWRNVTEQPEAARRLQIVRAPVEFTSTVQSGRDMNLIDLIDRYRDALLALWGVPLSQLGIATATGLNGGDVRKYDEATLWQGAVDGRIKEITEAYQHSILDLWEPVLGWAPKLCFDPPTFDDKAPNYEMAQRAVGLPLRNKERRAIVGLDPFGDPAIDNAVWMPINVTQLSMAPDEDTGLTPSLDDVPHEDPPPAPAPFGGGPADPEDGEDLPAAFAAKAASMEAVKAGLRILPTGARKLRDEMEARVVPRVIDAVQAALETQAESIADRVALHWESIKRHNGRDDSMWWTDEELLGRALKPAIAGMAGQVAEHIGEAFGGGAGKAIEVNLPAPIVNLPPPRSVTKTVHRDAKGQITHISEEAS